MNLEVVSSTKIHGKKPWPNFAWLQKGGNLEEILFVLDNKQVGQLSLDTGKISQSFPSLSGDGLAMTQTSHSGSVVAGLTEHGHMVTWLQPSHQLATYTTPLSAPHPHPQDLQGCHLFVSDSGEQALLMTGELELHLWELRDGLHSEWWRLPVPDDVCLPRTSSRNTAIDATFTVHQVLGECCECDIVFTNKETGETTIANLLLTWNTSQSEIATSSPLTNEQVSRIQKTNECRDPAPDTAARGSTSVCSGGTQPAPVPFPVTIDWKSCAVSSPDASPHHSPCGRGCYVVKLAPTARVVAVAVNHNTAADTHIMFMDLLNEVSLSSPVYLESNREMTGRTFWVTSLSWSGDGLLLGAMTHRGCLFLLPRFGPPLRLITSGCGLDLGPTYLLPLHPLITVQNVNVTDQESSDAAEVDPLRQRFSVATHPRLPLLLCSDGYCLTVLKLPSDNHSLPHLVFGLLNTGRCLLGLPPITTSSMNETCSGLENEPLLCGEPVTMSPKKTKLLDDTLTHPHGCESFHMGKISEKERKSLARAHLVSAWGLLLSAGSFQPGNGVYPVYLTSQSVKKVSSDIHIVKKLVMKTMMAIPLSALEHGSQQELLVSVLSMSFLDQLDQNCCKLVYNLAHSIILTMLSDVLQKHTVFGSSSTHTAASVETYAEDLTSSLQQLWQMYQKVTMLVAELYSLPHSDIQKVFSLPLLALRRTCSILSRDLLACNRLAETMLPSGPGSLGLQGREAGLMQGTIANSISEASAVLASISDALGSYCDQKPDAHFVLTGFSSGEPLQSGYTEDGVGIERVPHLLQKCKLRQALECVYSLICGDSGNVSACQLSVPGIILVPFSVLAGKLVSHPLLNSMLHLSAKFMAAFFYTKTSKIVWCPLPVAIGCPALSRRRIEVAHKTLTGAIAKQNLSTNWTPTHAVELLLLGGLWYEAARIAVKTGDWKTGLTLCAVIITLSRTLADYQLSSDTANNLTQVEKFSHKLAVGRIFRELRDRRTKACPVDQTGPNLHLISGVLTLCESGRVSGVCPQVSFLIHQRLWTSVDSLPVRVSEEFQLPSPPLYDISTSTDVKDSEEGQKRQTLAHLIRSSLQMLCGSNSLDLCCSWYSSSLVQLLSDPGACPSVRVMPSVDGTITEPEMPSLLLQLSANFSGLDSNVFHSVQCQLALFRELCSLLWLLHVRDKASQHLRQVFQSDLSEKESVCESEQTVSECALWCARLLPLRPCQQNPSHIEDILLSVLSELPCNRLLVTLLAQNFPDSPQLGSRKLKMEQLLARMRTAVNGRNDRGIPQPFSVDYQIMSRTVLEDQASGNLQTFSPLCVMSGSGQHELALKEKALHIGSFVFEYDQHYLDFLELFFSSVANHSTASSKSAHSLELFPLNITHGQLNTTTSSYHHVSVLSQPFSPRENSEDLQALVTYFYEWSQRNDSRTLDTSHDREQKNDTGHPPMRIELSLSFLMYCLRLEEEKHEQRFNGHPTSPSSQEIVTKDTNEGTITTVTDETISTMSAATAAPEENSSLTTVTSAPDSVNITVTGELSMTTITPLPDEACVSSSETTVPADTDSTILSDSTLHAEDLGTSDGAKNLSLHPLPLLHLPNDVTLPQEKDGQPGPAISGSTHSLSSTIAVDDLTVTEGVSFARDMSRGQLMSDLDLTDCQSTGEVPSLLTFSVGEFGSGLTPHSCGDVLPLSHPAPLVPQGCEGVRTNQPLLEPQLLEYVPVDTQERNPTVIDSQIENQRDHPTTHQPAPIQHHDVQGDDGLTTAANTHQDIPECRPSTTTQIDDVQKHHKVSDYGPAHSDDVPEPCNTAETLKNNSEKQSNQGKEMEESVERTDGREIDERLDVNKGPSGITTVGDRISPKRNIAELTFGDDNPTELKSGDGRDSETEEQGPVATCSETQSEVEDEGGCEKEREMGEHRGGIGKDNTTEGGGKEAVGVIGGDATVNIGKLQKKEHRDPVVEMHHTSQGPEMEERGPSLDADSPTSQSTADRDQKKVLGKIVRSELKRFFKEQHQQLMDMLVDSSDVIENKTPENKTNPCNTDSSQVASVKSPDSEHTRQSWSSSGHLSMRHLRRPQLPLLLPTEPLRRPQLTHSSQSQTIHSQHISGDQWTQNLVPGLPLLQLHTGNATGSPAGQLPQLPSPPVHCREPSTSPFPLLTLDHTGPEDPLLPKLQHIPVSPTIFSRAPFSQHILPLLQIPHPNPTSVCQTDTHNACFHLFPTLRLPPPPTSAGRTPELPLLLPTQQATPPYPSLITLPSPPLDKLLSVNLVVKGIADGQETKTSSKKLQEDIIDTEKQPVLPVNKEDQREENVLKTSTENRQEQTTKEQHQRQTAPTLDHTEADGNPLPESRPHPPRPSLHPSPLSHTTQRARAPGSPCLTSVHDTVTPTDLGEDVPQSEDTNSQQLNPNSAVTSSENEGDSLDGLNRQTGNNPPEIIISQPPIAAPNNETTNNGGVPISSTDNSESERGSGIETVVKGGGVVPGGQVGRLVNNGDETAEEEDSATNEEGEEKARESPIYEEQGTNEEAGDRRTGVYEMVQNQKSTLEEENEEEEREDDKKETKNGENESRTTSMANREVLSRLRQLETQLTAIETRARTVEGELLISNQLLGTIEELQAVHKKITPTITAPRTGDPVQQSSVPLYSTTSSPSPPQATITGPLPTLPTASTTPPPTSITTTTTSTAVTIPPPTSIITTTTSTAVTIPPPTAITTTTTSTAVSSHAPALTLSATVSGTQQSIIQLNERSDVCPRSLSLSGRCSKQTLRKWVTAKRREKSSISPQPQSSHRTTGMVAACPTPFSNNQMVRQSIVKQDLARTQSREDKSRRIDDALTLMEDILSAEPPSPALHPVTDHRRTSSKLSSSKKGYSDGEPVMRRTIAGTPTNNTPKPMARQLGTRNWSSVEGLTPQEQLKMADIMGSTELSSVSSGSVASRIDWELVDQLIDN